MFSSGPSICKDTGLEQRSIPKYENLVNNLRFIILILQYFPGVLLRILEVVACVS